MPRRQSQEEETVPRPRAEVDAALALRPLDVLIYSADRLFLSAFQSSSQARHSVRWAHDLEACIRELAGRRPDVGVLDLQAVSRPGSIAEMIRICPRLPLALWVPELPVEWAVHALDQGVLGIFLRSSEPAAVVRALAGVARGERAIDPDVLTEIVRSRSVRVRDRELAIAVLVERCSNKEIADRMAMSEESVKRHLHTLYGRLRVRGRSHLASVVARNYGQWHGLLPMPGKLVIGGGNLPTK